MVTKKKFFEIMQKHPNGKIYERAIGDGWVSSKRIMLVWWYEINPSSTYNPLLSCRMAGSIGHWREGVKGKIQADKEKFEKWIKEYKKNLPA